MTSAVFTRHRDWQSRAVPPDDVVADVKSGDNVFVHGACATPIPLLEAIGDGRADFIPVFLSDIPALFETRQIDLDVAILQLSAPDAHGHCTRGPPVDTALAAGLHARTVVAEINTRMPRTSGDTVVPMSRLAAWCASDRPLTPRTSATASNVERRIGEIIADLIDDGYTLQLGIGGIPDAILARLGNTISRSNSIPAIGRTTPD